MGASYWARWACNGQVSDLPELILPHVLEQGYELLSCEPSRQIFDRGGLMSRISWSLNQGRWSKAPVDLTITYSYSTTQTIANFYWKLAVRPLAATAREQALFETQIQDHLNRIISRLNEQLLEQPVEPVAEAEAAQEGASLQAYWEHAQASPDGQLDWSDTAVATATRAWSSRTSLVTATACVEEVTRCHVCHRPAVPLPGTANRYFCLACGHHVSCQPAA